MTFESGLPGESERAGELQAVFMFQVGERKKNSFLSC